MLVEHKVEDGQTSWDSKFHIWGAATKQPFLHVVTKHASEMEKASCFLVPHLLFKNWEKGVLCFEGWLAA